METKIYKDRQLYINEIENFISGMWNIKVKLYATKYEHPEQMLKDGFKEFNDERVEEVDNKLTEAICLLCEIVGKYAELDAYDKGFASVKEISNETP